MAASVIVDAGFLVALLSSRDVNHGWAAAQAARLPPPWATCETSVAEAFRLLGPRHLARGGSAAFARGHTRNPVSIENVLGQGHMNAVEIEEAISTLAEQAFDSAEFPFAFLQAFGNKDTTIKRLRAGASNKSDLGGVLQ